MTRKHTKLFLLSVLLLFLIAFLHIVKIYETDVVQRSIMDNRLPENGHITNLYCSVINNGEFLYPTVDDFGVNDDCAVYVYATNSADLDHIVKHSHDLYE